MFYIVENTKDRKTISHFYSDTATCRGGEWFFKNSGSRKNFSRIWWVSQSRCLSGYVRLAVSFFIRRCPGVSEHFEVSVSHLKSQNVSGLQRKTLVSPSRKVSHLPFATPTCRRRKVSIIVIDISPALLSDASCLKCKWIETFWA